MDKSSALHGQSPGVEAWGTVIESRRLRQSRMARSVCEQAAGGGGQDSFACGALGKRECGMRQRPVSAIADSPDRHKGLPNFGKDVQFIRRQHGATAPDQVDMRVIAVRCLVFKRHWAGHSSEDPTVDVHSTFLNAVPSVGNQFTR